MIPTPQHSDQKQTRFIKEGKCFICKESGNIAYDCHKKGKIVAILEGVSKDSDSQRKE